MNRKIIFIKDKEKILKELVKYSKYPPNELNGIQILVDEDGNVSIGKSGECKFSFDISTIFTYDIGNGIDDPYYFLAVEMSKIEEWINTDLYNLNKYLIKQKEEYGEELVNKVKNLDPSDNFRHVGQICRFYNEGISKEEIKEQIDEFYRKNNEGAILDDYNNIDKVESFSDLKDILRTKTKQYVKQQQKRKYSLKCFYKTIENSKGIWDVYKPTHKEEQIAVGEDTKWNISSSIFRNYFNNYYIDEDVTFYMVVNRNNDYEKFLVWVYLDDNYKIYDYDNEELDDDEFYRITNLDTNMFEHYRVPLNGEYEIYDRKGNLRKRCNYINGNLNGYYVVYDENGKIIRYQIYKNGKIINGR